MRATAKRSSAQTDYDNSVHLLQAESGYRAGGLRAQLAGLLENGNYSALVAHRQGSVIVSKALNALNGQSFNFGGGLTVRYYGAAANRYVAKSLATSVNAVWGSVQNHPFDAVGNVIGLNTLTPFKFVGSILAAPALFNSLISSHSSYPLQ